MSKTVKVNGNTYHVKCNRIPRELLAWKQLEHAVIGEWFGEDYNIGNDDMWSPRFFQYRGAWYDMFEFERAGHDVSALGFDGVQTESAFSAVVVSYFDRDGYEYEDGIVVGYIHW